MINTKVKKMDNPLEKINLSENLTQGESILLEELSEEEMLEFEGGSWAVGIGLGILFVGAARFGYEVAKSYCD